MSSVSASLAAWYCANAMADLLRIQKQGRDANQLAEKPRILVVALRRLGDVLLTTPLIRSIKRAFPAALRPAFRPSPCMGRLTHTFGALGPSGGLVGPGRPPVRFSSAAMSGWCKILCPVCRASSRVANAG